MDRGVLKWVKEWLGGWVGSAAQRLGFCLVTAASMFKSSHSHEVQIRCVAILLSGSRGSHS